MRIVTEGRKEGRKEGLRQRDRERERECVCVCVGCMAAPGLEMGQDEHYRTQAQIDSGEFNAGTEDSHRRRSMLAAHHKDFIGEDGAHKEADDTSMLQFGGDTATLGEKKMKLPSWPGESIERGRGICGQCFT